MSMSAVLNELDSILESDGPKTIEVAGKVLTLTDRERAIYLLGLLSARMFIAQNMGVEDEDN